MTTIASTTPAPRGIAYEVLRRNDGVTAVSVDVGVLPFVPASSALKLSRDRGGDLALLLRGSANEDAVVMLGFPKDVAQQALKRKSVWLFEFGPAGLAASHEVPLEVS